MGLTREDRLTIEVTEEMRRAVYAQDCKGSGHLFDTASAVGVTDEVLPENPSGAPTIVLRAPDPSQLPHLLCRRCGQVWLVLDEPGYGYDDAVTKALARVGGPGGTPSDAFTPRRPRGVLTEAELQQRHGHAPAIAAQPADLEVGGT